MSREIQAQAGLTVIKGNPPTINYRSPVTAFVTDLVSTSVLGPVGGAALVTTTGADLPLTGLVTPGWCWVYNAGRYDGATVDGSEYIQYGIHDGSVFHSFGELAPGEASVFKFSRDFGEENTVPGTGTTGTVNTFYAKAFGASQNLNYSAFDA